MFCKKFIYNGKELENGPSWGMSTLEDNSMRFRWNEENKNRDTFLNKLCVSENGADPKKIAQIELIHSKDVYSVKNEAELLNVQGDGIVTTNKNLIPVITVADCMPLFLYDVKTKGFGVLHSGWKGTGIAGNAVEILCTEYNSSPENICVVIGPHIGECCYRVDEERAAYFSKEFTPDCVKKTEIKGQYDLSLLKANLHVLKNAGVKDENLFIFNECTCCTKVNDRYIYGSFRRQMPVENTFTVQAAFVKW